MLKKQLSTMVLILIITLASITATVYADPARGETKVVVAGNNCYGYGWPVFKDYYLNSDLSLQQAKDFASGESFWMTIIIPADSLGLSTKNIVIGLPALGATARMIRLRNYSQICYEGANKQGVIIHTAYNLITGIELQR